MASSRVTPLCTINRCPNGRKYQYINFSPLKTINGIKFHIGNHPVVMLTQQDASRDCWFPYFYESKFNDEQMTCKDAPFHELKNLGAYVFYDISEGQELLGKNTGALSLYNEHEADAAVELLHFYKKRQPSGFLARRIGIITTSINFQFCAIASTMHLDLLSSPIWNLIPLMVFKGEKLTYSYVLHLQQTQYYFSSYSPVYYNRCPNGRKY